MAEMPAAGCEPNKDAARPMRHWNILPPAPAALLRQHSRLTPLVVQLLYNRGLTTGEQIDDFLARRTRTDNPFQLTGMGEAVTRIRQAIRGRQPVVVYGDFDADGVTATAVLVQALQALGAVVEPYIPHRVDEGYGVNREALTALAERGTRLVITVDCGIRSPDEIAHGRAVGLDIIVTDHHQPDQQLPSAALACINPRRSDSRYPFRELAGVGVAFKLAQALLRVEGQVPAVNGRPLLTEGDLLDLVALGTVADLVPLVEENRSLVARGLQRLNATARPGLLALYEEAGLRSGTVNSGHISFALGPRLNAAGRLDSALVSYDLLTTVLPAQAGELATRLGNLNRRRQQLTADAVALAQSRLAGVPRGPLLFVSEADIPSGIVGLVAGQLAETYYRPAVVVERGDLHSRGSARSIPEFHITEALDECARRNLLVRHGGHAAAAGFTVETSRLADLEAALYEIAACRLDGLDLSPTLTVDAEVEPSRLDWALLEQLADLEPFGYGNAQPVLASRNMELQEARTVGSEGKHLKMTLSDGWRSYDAIAFRCGPLLRNLSRRLDVAFHLEANEWNGTSRLQLNVLDVRSTDT